MKLSSVLLASGLSCCAPQSTDLDTFGRRYLELSFALEKHDPGYVDAYFGPVDRVPLSLSMHEIRTEAMRLRSRLAGDVDRRSVSTSRLLEALLGRLDVLEGNFSTFDTESMALYGVVAPRIEEADLRATLGELEALLPGDGPLVNRYDAFRSRFLVLSDKIEALLTRTLEECRLRTSRHINLPEGENVRIELVRNKPWAAYHRYLGGYGSVVEFNVDFPLYLDRVVDEICHEAYPGHHVQMVLSESELVLERGWIEHSLHSLYGSRAFLAEGAATYGVELVFPGDERKAFERDVLFHLAGFDPEDAERYDTVRKLSRALRPAVVEGLRRFLDRELDPYSAILWLEKYALMREGRATLAFADRYRSQIQGYTLGEDLVRRHVNSRWDVFRELWTAPLFTEDL